MRTRAKLLLGAVINLVLFGVASYFASRYMADGPIKTIVISTVIVFGFVLFLFYVWLVFLYKAQQDGIGLSGSKYANEKEVEHELKLNSIFNTLDVAIQTIAYELSKQDHKDVNNEVYRAIDEALSNIPFFLGVEVTDKPTSCVLLARNDTLKFTVLSSHNLHYHKRQKIERDFSFAENAIMGVAGYAACKMEKIFIGNLATSKDTAMNYWMELVKDEPKKGFMCAYPIIRGIGEDSSGTEIPLAVICLSSKELIFPDEFRNDLMFYLGMFAQKIETLIYFLQN